MYKRQVTSALEQFGVLCVWAALTQTPHAGLIKKHVERHSHNCHSNAVKGLKHLEDPALLLPLIKALTASKHQAHQEKILISNPDGMFK